MIRLKWACCLNRFFGRYPENSRMNVPIYPLKSLALESLKKETGDLACNKNSRS